jgi:hypothetical protein
MTTLLPNPLSAVELKNLITNYLVRAKVINPQDNVSKEIVNLAADASFLKLNDLNSIFTHIADNPKTFTGLAPKIKTRFAAIDMFKKNYPDKPAINYQDVIDAEQGFNKVGVAHSAMDILTPELTKTLIGNGVDVQELNNRFNSALDQVQNADEGLKQQLFTMYPGAKTVNDLQKAMLLGKDAGSEYLKNKVTQAGIQASFAGTGYQSALGAEELAKAGVTRDQAAGGALAAQRLNTLSGIYEGGLTDETAKQNEMAAMGIPNALASQRRAKLTQLEQAQFSGVSGVGSTSLSKRRAGQL